MPLDHAARALLIRILVCCVIASPPCASAHNPNEPFRGDGTQPADFLFPLAEVAECTGCHREADPPPGPSVTPGDTWAGSMMANSARDPFFLAAMTIANQDVHNAGSFCLRCHAPTGWLNGHSLPANGSALTEDERQGVTCALCHRLDPGPGALIGNGRGRLFDALSYSGNRQGGRTPHATRPSAYVASSELCGVCHSVSNPADHYLASDGTILAPELPEQRTYEEWQASAFPAEERTCQSCHMKRVIGRAAHDALAPLRPDIVQHDFAGANAWGALLLDAAYPGERPAAYALARTRALAMLRTAANVEVNGLPLSWDVAGPLPVTVRVTNLTGHKLPTGYLDGRRMWLEVEARVGDAAPYFRSPRYDAERATLPAEVFTWAARAGTLATGPHFHFLQYDTLFRDTRIPPRGFRPAPDLMPVGHDFRNEDGSFRHWDEVVFEMPPPPVGSGVIHVFARLRYQTVTRELVEFLRDENVTDDAGRNLFSLWQQTGEGAPEEMGHGHAATRLEATPVAPEICDGADNDDDGEIDENVREVRCGVGACAVLAPDCVQGEPADCQPAAAQREMCNRVDDDCDGQVDEDLIDATCGFGICQRRAAGCVDGVPAECTPGPAGEETCNGEDDDCDGLADEALGEHSCGVGACNRVVPTCIRGREAPCTPAAPVAEICNGADDDCDGETDEDVPPTRCGIGACERVVEGCERGSAPECEPAALSEERCNGMDDDCDGEVDEALGERTCGVGACRRSQPVCVDGVARACVPADGVAEVCNGIDDDCDGEVDDAPAPEVCGYGRCQSESTGCVGGVADPCVLAEVSEGEHILAVRATDTAGNETPEPPVARFTLDRTGPVVRLLETPAAEANTSTAIFAFETEAGARADCALDERPFSPCASPFAAEPLGDGAHVFHVRATDAAGNVSDPEVTFTWQIDATAPQTVLSSAPDALTRETAAVFEFDTAAPQAATFLCGIDARADVPCVSPWALDGLADGEHTFRVAATDPFGNLDTTPATHPWTVDTTPPETSAEEAPERLTRVRPVRFVLSSEAEARFECRLDDAEFAACEMPFLGQNLPEGEHLFEGRSLDRAGNLDRSPVRVRFTLDITPPQTEILSAPEALTRQNAADFTLGPAGARFTCALDGAPAAACDAAPHFAGLAEGDHRLSVLAADEAGNVNPEPVVATWRVDHTPPEITLTDAPPDRTGDRSARFAFSLSEPGIAHCTLDVRPAVVCDGEFSADDLPDGDHRFSVTATDVAGNATPSPAVRSWIVDSSPPEAPAAPAVWPGDGTVLVEWPVIGDDVVEVQVHRQVGGAGAFALAARVNPVQARDGMSTYVDRGVSNGTSYAYRLVAVDTQRRTSDPGGTATTTPTQMGHFEVVPNIDVRPWTVAMLHTGDVLLTQNNDAAQASRLFDPVSRTLSPVATPLTNTFCAGIAHLTDGRILVVGGHEGEQVVNGRTDWLGLEFAQVFDPETGRWTALPDMPGGKRWYPTPVVLADGRVLVTAGTDARIDEPQHFNRNIDLYDPASNTWEAIGRVPDDITALYPRGFVRPDGNVLFLGPQIPTHVFTVGTWQFNRVGRMSDWRDGGVGMPLETGEILYFGGHVPPLATSEIYDPDTQIWRFGGDMHFARLWPNGVYMPGGKVFVVGGQAQDINVHSTEIFDPQTGQFTLAGDNFYGHEYHSSAVLLPDASIFSGGPEPRVEIYMPWYLGAGPRPEITDVPRVLRYGTTFTLSVASRLDVTEIVIVRLGGGTHAMDLDQRHLTLDHVAEADGTLTVDAPAGPTLAIGGYYYVFALDERGVPSRGEIVRLE